MPETILTLFRRNALRLGSVPCLHYKEQDVWKNLSWVDAEESVRRYTLGLAALGLKKGSSAAILSKTRMEWTLLDLSILANQAVSVPIYSTLAPEQAAYILEDSKATLLIVEDPSQWGRLKRCLKDWRGPVILMQGEEEGFISLKELCERGKALPVNQYDENLRQIQPSDTATVIYTSGTTGPPKGAILTHRNLLSEVQGLQEAFQFTAEQIGFLCLPLAHVIARAMQFYQLAQGCQTAYVESLEKISLNLTEVRPHFMAGVPRLFEKMHDKILSRVYQSSKPLQKIFFWSLKVGTEVSELKQKKMSVPLSLAIRFHVADGLVFRKVRKAFGGRLICFVSGGASLSKKIAQFFHALNILVVEGYGLTETFAAITLNRRDDFRFGTVGKPLEGVRIKIAEDGEICVKGDNVFSGYLHSKEAASASFDREGWFLTGDVGEFTKDGYLRITDRKKDLIKTSGGKNIAPQNIENLMQQSHYIQQIMVYGEGKKFLSALVTLHWEAVEAYAKREGIPISSHAELAHHPKIAELVQGEIEERNKNLSSFETIKKFVILGSDFSVESGELTPTMKIKRKIVAEKYKQVLDQLYLEV